MKKLKLEELNRVGVEAFKKQEKHPLVFILDNIRSFNNVGSAFRTADALGIEALYLCGITPKPPHRDIQKTALGATLSVEWEHHNDIVFILNRLKDQGFKIIAVEQTDSSISLDKFNIEADEKLALIFGNEVKGVSDEVFDYVDLALEIPQFGTKHSFNVSVCMGVVGWHLVQQII